MPIVSNKQWLSSCHVFLSAHLSLCWNALCGRVELLVSGELYVCVCVLLECVCAGADGVADE